MKVSRYIAAAFLSLILLRSDALAMPIVFDVTGSFNDHASLGGTMTIDTTLGTVTAVDLTISSPLLLEFTVPKDQVQQFGTTLTLGTGQSSPLFDLYLPVASLINYTGGNLCSAADDQGCGAVSLLIFNNPNDVHLDSGSATGRDLPAVPEPATLILFGSGLLGMVARWRPRATSAERSR